jgi:hypothetical protein
MSNLFNPGQLQSQQTQFSNGGGVTSVELTTTITQVVPDRTASKNRRNLMVYNDGTSGALFAYGTTVSATTFTAEILPSGFFADSSDAPWQGPAVMRSTNSPTSVNVTELIII